MLFLPSLDFGCNVTCFPYIFYCSCLCKIILASGDSSSIFTVADKIKAASDMDLNIEQRLEFFKAFKLGLSSYKKIYKAD